jgi:hypothetical protein
VSQLKLGPIAEDKPVKMTIDLPASVYRDLLDYARVHAAQTGQNSAPEKLVPPMLERFMATDRGFAKARRQNAENAAQPRSGGSE